MSAIHSCGRLTGVEPNSALFDQLAHGGTHAEAAGTRVDENNGVLRLREPLGNQLDDVVRHLVACHVVVRPSEVVHRVRGRRRAGERAALDNIEGRGGVYLGLQAVSTGSSWRTYERILEALGRHLGAHDIHRQLDIRRTALGQAQAERLVKRVSVRRVRVRVDLVEERLRAAQGPRHVRERGERRRRVERVVQQCLILLRTVSRGILSRRLRLTCLHLGARGADEVEDREALGERARDAAGG